jgi:hypothetical protein
MNRRPAPPKRHEPINWGELLFRYGGVLAKAGLAGFIVCGGYYIYAIYGGVLQSPGADPQRAQALISSFGMGLIASSVCLALGLVLVTLEEVVYAVIIAIGGVSLMLGVPYLVASNLSSNLGPSMQGVARALSNSGVNAGIGVLGVVGLRILYELVIQIQQFPERRRQRMEKEASEDAGILKKQKTIKGGNVMTRCWELPFCHERIKEICPAYKARKTCWRYGIGCNCDPKLIESLIRMGAPGSGKQSNEMRQRQGEYIRSDLEADVQLTAKAERTIPCAKCPIYNEHQRLKFKFVNPLAMGITVVGLGFLYVPITDAWGAVAGGIVQVARNITLRSNFDAGQWFSYLQDDVVKIAFFVIVSLLVMSYVLKFTEWVILQKKL